MVGRCQQYVGFFVFEKLSSMYVWVLNPNCQIFVANTGSPPLTRFFGPKKIVLKEKRVKGGVF